MLLFVRNFCQIDHGPVEYVLQPTRLRVLGHHGSLRGASIRPCVLCWRAENLAIIQGTNYTASTVQPKNLDVAFIRVFSE